MSSPPAVVVSPPLPVSWRMLRRWSDQRPLLECQHARLEAQLAALIAQHRDPGSSSAAEQQLGCRSLLRALRLHLRLEERWLQAHGLLCPGHRGSHQAAFEAATAQWQCHGDERSGRLALLEGLQVWFLQHLQGPDALAYALASDATLAVPSAASAALASVPAGAPWPGRPASPAQPAAVA